jgi:hypothetical protein
MKYIKSVVLAAAVLAAADVAKATEPASWDILNETYGSGAGQVSFNGEFTYNWSSAASEALADGHATLTLAQGSGVHYPCRASIPGMPTNGGDMTLEIKVRMVSKTQMNFYYSETASASTSHWNHILLVNGIFGSGNVQDALSDYNRRTTATNQAPTGFDGGVVHTYRIVRDSGRTFWYLYDGGVAVPVKGEAMLSDGGAAGDAQILELGLVQSPDTQAQVEIYSLKMANGAYPRYYDALNTFSWDILNETYGNGAGQVLFNSVYNYPFTMYTASETPSNGYTTLTIEPGESYVGPVKDSIPGMTWADADVTMEVKFRVVNNTPVNFGLAEEPYASGINNNWNHIWQVNELYDVATPNSLGDYNLHVPGPVVNVAPAGFDGSVVHTYRVTRQNGTTYLWLDDSSTAVWLTSLVNGAGAGQDRKAFEITFVQHPTDPVVVQFYSLKIGHGASPRYLQGCGDLYTVYLAGDINHDCVVDFKDFANMAQNWFKCSDSTNPTCVGYWH